MKKTTKISLMSGLVTAGVLLCGVHIANAQTNIDSGYTVLIPSEVTIDKESGKGSFSVSGKMDAQTELDVTTTSQNNYKLKCGSQFVDYTLDKQSFHIDNIKSANPKSFNEDFNITLANTNTNYSGNYKDRLTFNIGSNKYTYELDLNSVLDGVNNYSVHDYGTADIYINGEKVADDVSDWGGTVHYGDIYEINDIKGTTGHHYSGIADGWNNMKGFPLKGKIGIDTKHVENSKGILYSSIFLKFDTNTYTVKYDSNGGNRSMADTVHKYYKSDKMDGVIKLRKNTFTKTGYKFQGWYLTRVINKEIYYLYDNWQWYKDNEQPSGVEKYFYKDEERSCNATTTDGDIITAIAQWEKAYSVGDTLDIEGTKYVVLKQKENNQALVITANIIGNRAFQSKTRDDGTDIRTYEGSEIDNYLENDWYNNLSPTMKNAIQMTDINQIGYYNLFNVGKYNSLISLVSVPDPGSGPNPSPDTPDIKKEDKIYNKISRHVYLPSIADIGNVVDLNSLPSIRNFLNGTSFWTRDHSRPTQNSDNVYTFNADSMSLGMLENTQTKTLTGVRPAFVIDLSQVNYSVVK